MPFRHHYITNPPFQEYAYRIFMSLSEEQKKELPLEDQKLIKDHKATKLFVESYHHDRIKLLLTKVGYSWVEIFAPDEEMIAQAAFATYGQYEFPLKRSDLTDAMSRHKIFVGSDREQMTNYHMMAQDCMTKIYSVSEMSKNMIGKAKLFTHIEAIKQSADAWRTFNNLVLEHLASFEWAQEKLNLNMVELRVLCALFNRATSAIKMSDLGHMTRMGRKTLSLKKTMDELLKKDLVTSDVKLSRLKGQSVHYIITSKGLSKVMMYLKYLQRVSFGT